MADNRPDNQTPAGLDEFLTDMDPQSAVAAQGLQAIPASPIVQNLGQQALGNLQNVNDLALRAANGDPQAAQQLAEHHAQLAMGSIDTGAKVAGGLIGKVQQKVGASSLPTGYNEKVEAAKLLLAQAEEAFKAGMVSHNEVAAALQKLKSAQRVAQKNSLAMGGVVQGYAKGGEAKVSTQYPAVPAVPVSSLPVSAPEGLDAFLQSNVPIDSIGTQSVPSAGEPQGLDSFIGEELQQSKFGTPIEQGKAALEGLAQGLVGPLAPLAETSLGVNPDDIRARAEANPLTHYGTEIAGLVGPAIATGGGSGILSGLSKFTQAGALSQVAKVLPKVLDSGSLASKIGVGAARAAVDNMLIAGSDEVSKMILKDPNQSAETAMANVGLSGALGAGLGGTLGAGAHLWDATIGGKASKLIEDFKGRINEHTSTPDPVGTISGELGDYYTKIRSLGDDVYGPTGLKARDIQAALPELNESIATQAQRTYDKLQGKLKEMLKKPNLYPERLRSKLQADVDQLSQALSKENLSSADVFTALQDTKQALQGYSKFDKFVKPVDEAYDFVRSSKELARDLRLSLEDKAVWGKAAHRQEAMNKAFSEYLPALKDFEKKFTTEVVGERQIDPGKINTYINQIGKPNAEIKQLNLRNFLEASERYKKVIGDSHTNLGLESPVQDAAMNATLRTLDEKTLGSKLADAFIEKGLKTGGSSGAGASVGAALGSLLGGHPGAGFGAIVGQHALAPFFNSILPAIAKAILSTDTSPQGLKAAVEYGVNVAKGEALITKAVKNVFKASSEVLPPAVVPSEKHLEKLDKMLQQIQTNPDLLFKKVSSTGHYLPDHSQSIDQSTAQAAMYLNSLRPDTEKQSPLDSKPVVSSTQKSAYDNALKIAQDPTLVLDKLNRGTLTQQDIVHLGSMYPSLYNGMKQKLMDGIVEAKRKGETIPYKTRIGLSMFLAQPLDSTMTPASLQATQIQGASSQQDQAQQQPASKGVKSSPALQKMPGMYRTPSQTRSERSQKD